MPGVAGGVKAVGLAGGEAAPTEDEEVVPILFCPAAAAAAAAARAAASIASSLASSARSAAKSASVFVPRGLKAEMGRKAGGRLTKRPFSRGRVATSRCFREETPPAVVASIAAPATAVVD